MCEGGTSRGLLTASQNLGQGLQARAQALSTSQPKYNLLVARVVVLVPEPVAALQLLELDPDDASEGRAHQATL